MVTLEKNIVTDYRYFKKATAILVFPVTVSGNVNLNIQLPLYGGIKGV